MTDLDALFAAVCADPENDLPRLVYADALEEAGDRDRAEFVRVQCELARLEQEWPPGQALWEFMAESDWVTLPAVDWAGVEPEIARRVDLTRRANRLWRKHRTRWAAGLPKDGGVVWTSGNVNPCRRGFVARVTAEDDVTATAAAERLRRAAPPVHFSGEFNRVADPDALAKSGLTRWCSGLSVSSTGFDVWHRTLANDPAARVRSLSVYCRGAFDAAGLVEALATGEHWATLRTLDLSQLPLFFTDAVRLLTAPHLRGLSRLRLTRDNVWPPDVLRRFAAAGFENLRELRITGSGLTDESAEILANAPSLRNLRYLDLRDNTGITGAGATALLCSPHLAGLGYLGLANTAARDLDKARLAAAAPGELRMVDFHGARLTAKDVAAVCRSPRTRNAVYLDLDDNGLTPGVVRELIAAYRDAPPPGVWLTDNRLDATAAKRLAAWPGAAKIQVLQLHSNPLGPTGVEALAASEHLAKVRRISVSGYTAQAAAWKVATARFGKRLTDGQMMQPRGDWL